MAVVALASATLGDFNVALVAAAGLIVPLSAQIDALLSVGLGPFQADLAVQFNAALAATATLSLQIGDPTAALQLAIGALAQLQAALQAALSLPPINLSLGAELSASAALVGALSARLGLLSLAIQAAIQIKLGALNAIASIEANFSAGPVVGIAIAGDSWTANGAKINSLFNGNTVDGFAISGLVPSSTIEGGVLLMCGSASAAAALSAIISI